MLSFILLCCCLPICIASLQHITIIGQTICSRTIISNISIDLWEADSFDPDDFLNATFSNQNGYFQLYGEESELGNIEPYLRILHNCVDGRVNEMCSVRDLYTIPPKYIGRIYDMGIVNLGIARQQHFEICSYML
ncbi:hypothetical protein AB6A40_005832 [Gnathostoma spinigerum]|uniref:Transthyretin-like family protein n=1 Tax=Gnathostoma spinigerum TaxID=75299 RepID=A0ABD6EQ45_9BILA